MRESGSTRRAYATALAGPAVGRPALQHTAQSTGLQWGTLQHSTASEAWTTPTDMILISTDIASNGAARPRAGGAVGDTAQGAEGDADIDAEVNEEGYAARREVEDVKGPTDTFAVGRADSQAPAAAGNAVGNSAALLVDDSSRQHDELVPTVLKLRPADLRTGIPLGAKQLQAIPFTFVSTGQYGTTFRPYIVEEVRADLEKGIQDADNNPSSAVAMRNVRMDTKPVRTMRDIYQVTAIISCSYKRAPGSICLPFKPTDVVLLFHKQLSCTLLAKVERVPAADRLDELQKQAAALGSHEVQILVTVLVHAERGSDVHTALSAARTTHSSGGSGWAAHVVGSLATPMRTFKAHQQLAQATLHNSALLQELLQHSPPVASAAAGATAAGVVNAGCSPASSKALEAAQLASAVRSYSQQHPAPDVSQQAVVERMVCPQAAGPLQRCSLVQGPPGTGKTATLVRALSVLGCTGKRVLACAPTNVAAAELARQYLSLIHAKQQFAQHVGSGSDLQLSQLSSGDVLLAGTESRLDLNSGQAAVYLPYRAKRLMGIAGLNGLRGTLEDAIGLMSVKLLASFNKQQHRPVARGSAGGSSNSNASAPDAAFAAFFAASLERVQQQLQAQLQVVAQDMPSSDSAGLLDSLQQLLNCLCKLLDTAQQIAASSSSNTLPASSTAATTTTTNGSLLDVYTALKSTKGRSSDFASAVLEPQRLSVPASLRGWLAAAQQLQQHILAVDELIPPVLRECADHNAVRDYCLSSCRHLFCTVAAAGAGWMAKTGSFAVTVVDEAAQMTEAEMAILLARSIGDAAEQQQQLVLVGDPKQLPATVISQHAAQQGYSRSLFERLQQRGNHVPMMLGVQYRCRPEISLWPRQQFYGGQLLDAANVCAPSYGAVQLQPAASTGSSSTVASQQLAPLVAIDVRGSWEVKGSGSVAGPVSRFSYSNPAEVKVVMCLLKQLKQQHSSRSAKPASVTVGIITPYKLQAALLLQRCIQLADRSTADTSSSSSSSSSTVAIGPLLVDVRSVDGFQGQERDIIIFSAVRSNLRRSLGFTADARRLNVALTRTRHMLVVVCNRDTVSLEPVWASFLASADARGTVKVLDCSGAAAAGAVVAAPGAQATILDAAVRALQKQLHKLQKQHQKPQSLSSGTTKPFVLTGCSWQVHLDDGFQRAWAALPPGDEANVTHVLIKLANGHWPAKGRMYVDSAVSEAFRGIIQVAGVKGRRLIWMVDVDHQTGKCTQIIKVWALVKPAEVATCVQGLEGRLATYTKEYLAQCKAQQQPPQLQFLPADVAGVQSWFREKTLPEQQEAAAVAA